LLTLIDDLLDFSKIEAGKMEVESVPLEPADLAEDLTTLHRSSGRAKVPVNLELDPDLPARMLGDPVRLRQVLNNLLSNAVKFTSQGSIRLRLLVKGEARDELEVRVEDDGIGIPADRLETIFESFTQADGSTTRNFGGTGLGLTISRSLSELMQGGLEVESEEGRGSTFIVRLPLVDPDRDRLSVPCCMLLLGDTGSSLAPLLDRLQVPYRALAIDDELWNEGRGFLSRQDDLRRLAVVDAGAAREEPELVRAFARHFQVELVWTGSGAAGSAAAEDEAVLPSQVDLPALESLLAREAVALAPDAADEDQAEPTGLRILVAEDHPTNATIVRRMLEALGHEVTLAADGKLAFESFREHGADLVLMDLQMPVMGGHEATKAIRALGDGDRVPIVALTAHAAAEERDRSLAVGMNDLLNKPFTREQLTEVLRTWGRRRARS
ncbi:MAG: ATP-binding protein, partial [Planctomycetota bacterium]